MTVAYQIKEADSELSRTIIERRPLGPRDVRIALKFCGICHSDSWSPATSRYGIFPMVPGHEMVGTISAIGNLGGRFRCWRRSGRRMHC